MHSAEREISFGWNREEAIATQAEASVEVGADLDQILFRAVRCSALLFSVQVASGKSPGEGIRCTRQALEHAFHRTAG